MSRKKRSRKGKTSSDIKSFAAKVLAGNPKKRFTPKQLKKKMKVDNSVDSIAHALTTLEAEGKVFQVKDGLYRWDRKANPATQQVATTTYQGKVDMTRSGAAYIIAEDLDDDIYVPAKHTNTAMNGDIVKVRVPLKSNRRRPEGVISDIVERSVTHMIGVVYKTKKYAIIQPISKSPISEIYVNYGQLPDDVEDGDQVLVEITTWGTAQNKAIWGKVTKKLEKLSHNDVTMLSILIDQGFDIEYPSAAVHEAEPMTAEITATELAVRRDFRAVTTFTIDPLTAKDFDDALSVQWLEDGSYEVGIHIADVTHYVRPGTALDQEAFNRSTSVYLVDRVIPMLLEKLSNDLCSLVPHEDRYVFSAVFTFDKDHKIKDRWLGKGIIHSDRRFTYEEAQEVIEGADGDHKKEILHLNKVAEKLRKQRFKHGAISFESDEVVFELDDDSVPLRAYAKERKAAHMLVEDFMLLANKEVAKYIAKLSKPEVPMVYRIHDEPDPDKLADFSLFAKELGVTMQIDTPRQIAKSINKLGEAARENDALKMLQPLAIRTMSKAVYSTDNIGHYGLAFDHYTHFTSPIRRYSDVLVHRILFDNLATVKRYEKSKLEVQCKHISDQEKKATDAERASKKYKQAEYISKHIGEVFEGRISGMIDKGIFVMLAESHAEGMIPFRRLGEHYTLSGSRLKAIASKSGHIISMGDTVMVKILSVDLEERQIDMALVDDDRD